MTDTVLTYKGRPITDLTKNELVDAMTWAFQEIEYQRERADRLLNAAALDEPEPEGPTDEELLEINDGAYFPGTDEVNDEDDSSWQYTSDYIRWLDENGTPEEQAAYTVKGLRAVFEAGRRWGRPAPNPVPVTERPPGPEKPTDEEIMELMELMPQQMRDDLAAAARAMSALNPDNINAASVLRIILNRHSVDHARAVLARCGNHSAPQPIPVSERVQQIEDLAADAVCGLRYIEQQHGRLYGVGWDRVYAKAERLLSAHALPLPKEVV